MKKSLLFIIGFLISLITFSQNDLPIANNDTVYIEMEMRKFIEVNVLKNDFLEDGHEYTLKNLSNSFEYHDSTITLYFGHENLWLFKGWYQVEYALIDETLNEYSIATIFVYIDNHNSTHISNDVFKARINCAAGQFYDFKTKPFGPDTYQNNNMYDGDLTHFNFPADSPTSVCYTSSLWIGGVDEDSTLYLAAERFRDDGTDFWPGPLSFQDSVYVDTATVQQYNRVWSITTRQIAQHCNNYMMPGYEPIEAIKTWPAHGDITKGQDFYLAPFRDINGDGIYNPYEGEFPEIRGDKAVFFILNDKRVHHETWGQGLDIEIHVMAYLFEENNPYKDLENALFFNYKVFNRSEQNYYDTYMGIYSDIDIGHSKDDYLKCDVQRGAYYGYNGDDFDGETDSLYCYGENPPAFGVVMLGGPYLDADGTDNPTGGCDASISGVNFGDGIPDNERFGMERFIYYNNNYTNFDPIEDPEYAHEYYQLMKGIWKDGQPITYGGIGYGGNQPCNYMFPGLTDPCFYGTDGEEPEGEIDWTEETEGNEPADRRGVGISGPFTFEAGSMHQFDVAYIVAAADEGEKRSCVDNLLALIDGVKETYSVNADNFGIHPSLKTPEQSMDELFQVYPNPVEDRFRIDIDSEVKDASYQITDIKGRILTSGHLLYSQTEVDCSTYKQGIYLLIISSTQGTFTKKMIK